MVFHNSLLNNAAYYFSAIHKVLVNSIVIHTGTILLMDKERKWNCPICVALDLLYYFPNSSLQQWFPLLFLPFIFLSIRVFSSESTSSSHLGGQSIGASASLSVLLMNPLGLTSSISSQSKGLLRVFSSPTTWKLQFFSAQPSLWSNSHICTWLVEKP